MSNICLTYFLLCDKIFKKGKDMDISIQENFFNHSNVVFFDKLSKEELVSFLKSIEGKTISFTGHRPNHLPWGRNEECDLCKKFLKKLDKLISLCASCGFEEFISGVALGFDTFACESVLKAKKKFPNLNLTLAIPCKNQTEKWSEPDKVRYDNLFLKANPVFVSNDYFKGCFIKRNHFMVDKADLVIACFNGLSGGTKSTVDYAIKKSKNVLIISP